MFQLCISKHNSSALRAVGALAGSSVDNVISVIWENGPSHETVPIYIKWEEYKVQTVTQGNRSTCLERYAAQICFLRELWVHRGKSIPLGKGTVRVRDSSCQGLSMRHCISMPSSSCLTRPEPAPESQLQSDAPSISEHCTWLCYLLRAVWVWGSTVCCRQIATN